jgi:hypothetical protein
VRAAVRRRMYAAAEAMMPGLRPQNLAVVARAAADVAAAMVDAGSARSMTSGERAELVAMAAASAERFGIHLAKPSTAEAWESFDVPWDHRRTLEAVRSGGYAEDLLAEALWVAEELAAMFEDMPPRAVRRARKAGQRELLSRGGPRLLMR